MDKHYDLPATVYCWKNYYETSGHWNVNPCKTVRAVTYARADKLDALIAAAKLAQEVILELPYEPKTDRKSIRAQDALFDALKGIGQ